MNFEKLEITDLQTYCTWQVFSSVATLQKNFVSCCEGNRPISGLEIGVAITQKFVGINLKKLYITDF